MPEDEPPESLATPEFVAALLADGDDDMAAWVIGEALEERPRADVFDGLLRPAMEIVGSRWETGAWSISQEHLASVSLMAALSRVRPGEPAEVRVGPVAVLAAPAGEQHVSGLACLAQILEERGWHVENLGANVPADDLRRFVSSRGVDLVALSIGTHDRIPALREAIGAIRAAGAGGDSLPLMVGGRGVAGMEDEIEGPDLVTASLVEAGQFVDGLDARFRSGSPR